MTQRLRGLAAFLRQEFRSQLPFQAIQGNLELQLQDSQCPLLVSSGTCCSMYVRTYVMYVYVCA